MFPWSKTANVLALETLSSSPQLRPSAPASGDDHPRHHIHRNLVFMSAHHGPEPPLRDGCGMMNSGFESSGPLAPFVMVSRPVSTGPVRSATVTRGNPKDVRMYRTGGSHPSWPHYPWPIKAHPHVLNEYHANMVFQHVSSTPTSTPQTLHVLPVQ